MIPTDPKTYFDVVEATWPPAAVFACGPFLLRDGQGGGQRVSAATATGDVRREDLPEAEARMYALGQPALVMVRQGEDALDLLLESAGYEVVDPVNVYAIDAQALACEKPPRTVAIPGDSPLKIMEELWAAGGIGPARLKVMERACSPKGYFISRWQDKPAGTFFAAMHGGISMVHALEIAPHMRRNGLGRWAMRRTGFWTLERGGHTVSVVCTKANKGANALYSSLGMHLVAEYHYRRKTTLEKDQL